MAVSNHYRTLGVNPDAEDVVIRSAYLALIRRYHPDSGGAEADAARAQSITAAWEVLRDPERRAAYDEGRRARFHPELGAVMVAGGPKVRGGAAARNLFLLLAAGTIGLGWWALQGPLGSGAGPQPRVLAAGSAAPVAEAGSTSPLIVEEVETVVADLPPSPPRIESNAGAVVLPAVPADSPPLPARVGASPVPERRVAAADLPVRAAAPARQPASIAATETKAAAIDLAPLERHLQLLTDQSYQFADAPRRSRLFATREAFLQRLNSCVDDGCRRDAYLRRNLEVAEIMRK